MPLSSSDYAHVIYFLRFDFTPLMMLMAFLRHIIFAISADFDIFIIFYAIIFFAMLH